MNKEYLQLLANRIRYKKEYIRDDIYRLYIKKNEMEFLEKELQRLESIDNAESSEALKYLKEISNNYNFQDKTIGFCYEEELDIIKQYILKSQEQEKENELLKEIIKSLFDGGRPLNQFTDDKGMLQIEVDDDGFSMSLGKYKGIDLDEKLKEVLENE